MTTAEAEPVVLCLGGPHDGESFLDAQWRARQASADHHDRMTRTSWVASHYVPGRWTAAPVLPTPLHNPEWSVTPWVWTGPEIPRGHELAGHPVHENEHENENGD